MHPVMYWVVLNLLIWPIEEIYNYNNPHINRQKKFHFILNWELEDFYYCTKQEKYKLKKRRKSDSKCKAKARRKWHEQQANKAR